MRGVAIPVLPTTPEGTIALTCGIGNQSDKQWGNAYTGVSIR